MEIQIYELGKRLESIEYGYTLKPANYVPRNGIISSGSQTIGVIKGGIVHIPMLSMGINSLDFDRFEIKGVEDSDELHVETEEYIMSVFLDKGFDAPIYNVVIFSEWGISEAAPGSPPVYIREVTTNSGGESFIIMANNDVLLNYIIGQDIVRGKFVTIMTKGKHRTFYAHQALSSYHTDVSIDSKLLLSFGLMFCGRSPE